MTLGAAKTAIGSSVVTPADYSVFISPSFISVTTGSGGATSPLANSNIVGGVGPFTYSWISDGAVFVNSSTSDKTSFSAGGFGTEVSSSITLTVTDEGNAFAETVSSINVAFSFGIQP